MKRYIFIPVFIAFILSSNQTFSQPNTKLTEPDTTLANQYFYKADSLAKKAQYDSSNYYFEKASVIYKEAKIWGKYVKCLNNIGINLRKKSKYENAMEYLKKALNVGLYRLSENHIEVTNVYNNIGVVIGEWVIIKKHLNNLIK